jgi:hypothetical protein
LACDGWPLIPSASSDARESPALSSTCAPISTAKAQLKY